MDRQKFRKALSKALRKQSGKFSVDCEFLTDGKIQVVDNEVHFTLGLHFVIGDDIIFGTIPTKFELTRNFGYGDTDFDTFQPNEDYYVVCNAVADFKRFWLFKSGYKPQYWYDENEKEEFHPDEFEQLYCEPNGVKLKDVIGAMSKEIRKEINNVFPDVYDLFKRDGDYETDTLEESTKLSLVQYLKSKGWDEDEISVLANGILTYKKWYKRKWRSELADDMNRAYYKPFGHSKRESGILQTFRNECGEYLAKITMKDLKELEQYLQ